MAKKPKRLYIDGEVLVTPHFSGIGHYTHELLRAIDARIENDKTYRVIMFVYFKNLRKAREYKFKNIRIIPSPFSLRISNGLKIRGKQPYLDLLFGKGVYLFPNFTSWPLKFSKSVPIIYDLSYEKYPHFAEPRNQAFLSSQVKLAAGRANFVATISENSKQEICDFYKLPPQKVGVFYPAVDQRKFFRRPTDEVEKVKNTYGIAGSYILFVGNIEPRKNLKNILLAYERLDHDIRRKHSLLLIGAKGWQDGEIFEIIDRLRSQGDKIQMPIKYVKDEDLPAFYSGASVFVYPSMYEGFGIPPLEAMACGAPVVSANNSSLPEAIGEGGLLVDALSVTAITEAIQKILTDSKLRADLVRNGYTQVDKFSWDREAKKLLDSLKELG
ncbi:MAG: glycosyltransferase family 1 protein [Candidatus Saccharimonadales bacterium]